jgi:hypothetical protein
LNEKILHAKEENKDRIIQLRQKILQKEI